MNIIEIIKENLPDGVEVTDKTLKAIEKEIKTEQGKEFIPKEQYSKKTEKIIELEADIKDLQGKATDADTYKQKYDDMKTKYNTDIAAKQKEYDDFKAAAETQKTTDAKKSMLRSQLAADGAKSSLIDLLELKFDIGKIEIDGDKIKNWDDVSKPVKEQYADVFGKTETRAASVASPPDGIGDKGASTKDANQAMNNLIRRIGEN